jgi:hypothetical protein
LTKEIDLSASLYELTETYPELIGILKEIGFAGVGNPAVRNTLGRTTTLPEGSKKQGKDLAEVLAMLRERGFEARRPEAE